MVYLGIDQSFSSTGITIIKDNCIVHFDIFKTDKQQDIFVRAWQVAEYIIQLIAQYHVDVVGIEGLAFGSINTNATRDLAGLQFTIVNAIRQVAKKQVIIVPPTALKKFATGSGKSKKNEMIAALPEDIRNSFNSAGYKKTTGMADLADSYFLAKYTERVDGST